MAEALDVPSSRRTFRREARIVDLADEQHGVVHLRQLMALGVSASAVRNRAADGRLHRIHRGVYAVGRRRLTARGTWMAAVLACGSNAVLSHRSSGDLEGLIRSHCRPDVTSPGRPLRNVYRHSSVTLSEADRTIVDGIPCTTVARTLVDIGDLVPPRQVERAVEQAEVLRVFDLKAVNEVLARVGPRKGAAVLRTVLGEHEQPALTRSDLEEAFLELCREAALPSPAVNAWVHTDGGALMVDFLWDRERLVVETDGYAFHSSRAAFARDRRRDRRLRLAGLDVLRFTWAEVVRSPATVAKSVQDLLARLARP